MALVDYVSSDEDETEDGTGLNQTPEVSSPARNVLKRKRDSHPLSNSELPPLPSKFHDLYASKARVSTLDDPSLHGGRKRITPHVDGNWPSHVYIEWYPSTTEHEFLTSLITSTQDMAARAGEIEVMSLLNSDLGSPLPLHVSLSRPVVFTGAQKDSFLELLQTNVVDCGVRPFELRFGSLSWVSNSEKTRWFLVLQLQKPEANELNRLLTACNGTVEAYAQPPLYTSLRAATSQRSTKAIAQSDRLGKNKSTSSLRHEDILDFSGAFHISIGWALEQPSSSVKEDATKATMDDWVSQSLMKIVVKVDMIKAKVGNIITIISLSPKISEEENMFGL